MGVERLEIVRREPYLGGQAFGATGSYERIDAIAHYAVDPASPANQRITDLALADRTDGLVRFTGDMTVLVPTAGGNRSLLLELPNRGNRVLDRMFNQGTVDLMPTDEVKPGDGFLMRHGWTLAWCGWQWDAPKPGPRMGIRPPQLSNAARAPDGIMQLRIQPNSRVMSYPLTDHHVGSIGNHQAITVADVDDADARLLVRDTMYGEPEEIPRQRWRFARDADGEPTADAEHVWLDGGFEAGRIYDVLYRPRDCPVAGAGLISIRDLGSFLRYSTDSPVSGQVDQSICEGISQCGRLQRTFLGLGLNTDEDGHQVFDGMLVHIGGGRRGEFNHRYGQPSVQPTPSFGHRFPFPDEPQNDPHSGREAGLLDAQRAAGNMPKIFYTDTSSEYWRGDASLAHTSVADGSDVALPDNVRRYLFASTQHVAGALPFSDISAFGSHGSNLFNVVDYRPLYRAALCNLLDWIRSQSEPPASVYPKAGDGTAEPREEIMPKLAGIPNLVCPPPDALPRLFPLDLGPRAEAGIGTFPAIPTAQAYPCMVSAVDADGNEIGGIRMPDVEVPVATHTGFNVRHSDSGGDGQILEYVGLSLPFSKDAQSRAATGDRRPSIAERYSSRDDYLSQIRAAAVDLVQKRHLLEEDIELCVNLAGERYDAVMHG
ncbi:MAG: alpha/beta hydrolase domain-containing protein [Hyphomicrobiaceae bacterium]